MNKLQKFVSMALCLAVLSPLANRSLAATTLDLLDNDVRRDATVRAVEKVLPGVVNIATAHIVRVNDYYDPIFQEFFGPTREEERLYNVGSGVIIDEDGYILTNQHVTRRASRIQVKLWDGRVYDAEAVANTLNSDIALLKIRGASGEKFQAVKLAEDDDIFLGETVIALGNPFGLGGSVSRGILSSKNRKLNVENNQPLSVQDWLQTDASINPGNSGGPLINLKGELIGLNNANFPKGQGIGFAIPIKQVSAALSELFSRELTDSGWLGLRVRSGSTLLEVASVQPGSPAEKAGLKVGSTILEVNGKAVNGLVDYNRQLGASANRNVVLLVRGADKTQPYNIQMASLDDLVRQKLGLVLLNLTQESASALKTQIGSGLYVQEVEKDGPADRAQLRAGILLLGVDGQSAESVKVVANMLAPKEPGSTVQLTLRVSRRNGPFIEFGKANVSVQVR